MTSQLRLGNLVPWCLMYAIVVKLSDLIMISLSDISFHVLRAQENKSILKEFMVKDFSDQVMSPAETQKALLPSPLCQ